MNNQLPEISARIDALEIVVAHQERLIAELNDVVRGQWRKIDALERQITLLREEFQNSGTPRDAPEPPPPHY